MGEGKYYIFFSGNSKSTKHELEGELSDGGKISDYVYAEETFNTGLNENYGKIERICLNNYKWWKKNHKHFDRYNYETH